jgi:chemotaxis signal transduction protein
VTHPHLVADAADPSGPSAVADGDAAAAAAATATADDAIVVWLGAGRFAVDLAAVAEVGRVPAVTRVPGLPVWLAGVANWRGRILPLLDLRALLGAESAELDDRARLLVLTEGPIAAGLLVEAVEGTTALPDIAAFPAASAPAGSHLLSGQAPREEGPIAVLDVGAVMRLREGLPRGRRTA